MEDISTLFNKSKKEYIQQLKNKYPNPDLLDGSHKLIIFGVGRMGRLFLANLRKENIPVKAFADNNKNLQGSSIDGVPVLSREQLKATDIDTPILVASLMYETPIYEQLLAEKFTNVFPLVYLNYLYPKIFISPEYENTFQSLFDKTNQKDIIKTYNLLHDNESKEVYNNLLQFRLTTEKKYIKKAKATIPFLFDKQVLPLTNSEVFVDCGGYDGDSIKSFLNAVDNKFSHIYSFEPDKLNYKILTDWITKQADSRMTAVRKGVYNYTGEIRFSESGTLDSRIINENNFIPAEESLKENSLNTIDVIKIDDYFKDQKQPTLIKMDIEGVETEALLGAKEIISKYKPKLAISIYHHATDFWKIPLLIKKLNKNYKLYIRHHTDELPDTMCYAI